MLLDAYRGNYNFRLRTVRNLPDYVHPSLCRAAQRFSTIHYTCMKSLEITTLYLYMFPRTISFNKKSKLIYFFWNEATRLTSLYLKYLYDIFMNNVAVSQLSLPIANFSNYYSNEQENLKNPKQLPLSVIALSNFI